MPDLITQLDAGRLLVFTLVLTRVSGLVMTAPMFGSTDVPMRVRVILAAAISVLIMPSQWNAAVADPGTNLQYAVYIGSELVIGLTLGLGIVVLFSGIQLAGQVIGQIGGLMLADLFDPSSGESSPLVSHLLFLTSLAVFLLIGGHRMVLSALLDTFTAIPIGSGAIPADIGQTFVVLAAQSFSLAIRAAAPLVAALLLTTLVMGLISRTLPQLNILMVGFGMNTMVTFGTLALVIGAAVWVFQRQVEPSLELICQSLKVPTPGR